MESVKLPVNQLAKHLAQLEIKNVKIIVSKRVGVIHPFIFVNGRF